MPLPLDVARDEPVPDRDRGGNRGAGTSLYPGKEWPAKSDPEVRGIRATPDFQFEGRVSDAYLFPLNFLEIGPGRCAVKKTRSRRGKPWL